ncbi:ribonuclease T2 family protein [Derxia gummosa]|uniref:Ribonuclease T2 family protein n=1 Tax=Derxia gummosa DSM 723 TaxID=1121388 RepID=A0A8B6XAD6_9BURK|nr:hypothetical protein [Derxia gummosa]
MNLRHALALAAWLFGAGLAQAAPNCALPAAADLRPGKDIAPDTDANRCLRRIVDRRPDYYMLVLSWSPGFCDGIRRRNGGSLPAGLDFQCGGRNRFGWIVHGLWGQSLAPDDCTTERGDRQPLHPRWCGGDLPPLPPTTFAGFMCTQPGADLLQGEWEKHGACGFADATAYFTKTKALYNALVLPDAPLRPPEIFRWMRETNPALRGVRMGWSGGSGELQVCYSTAWKPIDCPDAGRRQSRR